MRKLIALSIAAVFALGASGFAVAQDKKADDKKTEKSDMKAEKKADKKPVTKTANGTVKSAAADSIVVAGKAKGKDEEWTFGVDTKTSIKKGGKAITAGDIKAGDSVQVRYMEHDGKAMAQSVMVKGAPASAKKADKMETKPADKK